MVHSSCLYINMQPVYLILPFITYIYMRNAYHPFLSKASGVKDSLGLGQFLPKLSHKLIGYLIPSITILQPFFIKPLDTVFYLHLPESIHTHIEIPTLCCFSRNNCS